MDKRVPIAGYECDSVRAGKISKQLTIKAGRLSFVVIEKKWVL
jgi:hypothetical protein